MTTDNARFTRWNAWIEAHHAEMAHIADFEARFARAVLAQIPELDPEDVEPQHPFRDRSGRARRIDFMILNPAKGFALAIELDGYGKILKGYSAWDDFFVRQNALLESLGCMLLRYANKRWLRDPDGVAAEVREQLLKQAQTHAAREAKARADAEAQHRLDAWQKERDSLQASLAELRRRMSALEGGARREEDAASAPEPAPAASRTAANSPPQDAEPRAARRLPRAAAGPVLAAIFGAGLLLFGSRPVEPPPARSAASSLPAASETPAAPARMTIAAATSAAAASGASIQTSSGLRRIAAADALAHAGEDAVVCGRLMQIRSFKSLTFLNFEAPYPNAPFTAVVADDNAHAFAGINRLAGERLCVAGRIELYNGKPQILLKEGSQWLR